MADPKLVVTRLIWTAIYFEAEIRTIPQVRVSMYNMLYTMLYTMIYNTLFACRIVLSIKIRV